MVPGNSLCDHNTPLVTTTNNQASSKRDKPSHVNSLQASYFDVSQLTQLPKQCMKGDEKFYYCSRGRILGWVS